MKKYLSGILFFQFLSGLVLAQNSETIKRDSLINSLRIDSLKRLLPTKKDTARINHLNKIAESFFSQAGIGVQRRADSAFRYADIAKREAEHTKYKRGEVQALINLSTSKMSVQKIKECENYIRRALQLSLVLNDNKMIGQSYGLLAALENQVANYKKAIFYLQKTNELELETEMTTWLCMGYIDRGQYEDGFPYCTKCLQLADANSIKDTSEWGHELVQWSFFNMYSLYKAAGDYETAMDFALKVYKYAIENKLGWKMYADISDLYCTMGKYDSALYYWNLWKMDWNSYAVGHQAYGNSVLARIYLKTNQSAKVLPLLEDAIATFRKKGKEMGFALIMPLLISGEAYIQMGNPNEAVKYIKEAVAFAAEGNVRPEMMNGYRLLSSAYYQLGKNKEAYENLLKYVTLKDSIQNRQFLLRLNNYKREAEDAKKESRIGLLNRDNQIKRQRLKQETTFRNFIIAGFIALLFAGLYFLRNINLKRKNERLSQEQKEQEWKLKDLESINMHVELQRRSAELEMRALRAQMNPHFIFNSLSSINHFILKNEGKTASSYLTRFSRLIRMVLINSQKMLVTLDEELQMLELYLEMERLRFKNSFDYSITFLNTIDRDNIFIPSLLLQPFCENAIWHGLMHKQGQGKLDIELSVENNILNCTIADNGIGRGKAEKIKSKSAEKEKSMGLTITRDRLNLLNREKGIQAFYEIEDLKDEYGAAMGTKVTLKISFKNSIEGSANLIKTFL